jgi:membrane-associated phospholipid phosphatase
LEARVSEGDAAQLGDRLRAELPAKVAVWIGLAIGICVPYFTLQHVHWTSVHELPATSFDRSIAFSPRWIYAYASLAVLVPLAPLLAATRAQLIRYAKGLGVLCVSCFVVFLLFPVAGPRPHTTDATFLYHAIVAIDRPTNSLPSLHAGLTVYSLLFMGRVFAGSLTQPNRSRFVGAAATWGGLILYSTLATKQHWLLDLPAGALIALAAHRVAWLGAPAPDTTSSPNPMR